MANQKKSKDSERRGKGKPKSFADKAALVHTLGSLRKLLKIEAWDYLLIGDGSGTTWEKHCGWACLLIENGSYDRESFYGSFNRGTNIIAEMMAYVQPLLALSARKNLKRQPDGASRVHIVTDCEYVRNAGNKKIDRKVHKPLWYLLDVFKRSGLLLEFHWIPRDTIAANKYGHYLANEIRIASKDLDLSKPFQRAGAETLFDINPS